MQCSWPDDNTTNGKSDQTPRKARLPSVDPSGTRRVVSALAELAGPASRQRLASRLGVQLTGHMARSLGSAILYGFIEVGDDDKLVLTDRGAAFLGDDEGTAKAAEREAVMSTGFGAVIKRLATHRADASIVAVRFQEDQGLAEGPATERGKVLVKAARDAGLVANDRFDAAAIEDTIEVVGEPTAPAAPASKPAAAKPAASKPKSEGDKPKTTTSATGNAGKEGRTRKEPDAPFEQATAPVHVVLNIDASKLSASEIAAIVRELRGSGPGSTPAS